MRSSVFEVNKLTEMDGWANEKVTKYAAEVADAAKHGEHMNDDQLRSYARGAWSVITSSRPKLSDPIYRTKFIAEVVRSVRGKQ